MKEFIRAAGLMVLLAFFINPFGAIAQDSETLTVVGSGIVAPAVEAAAEASGAEADINITVTGTDAGYQQFCLGEAAVTTANRPISAEEEQLCVENGIEYSELLLGYVVLTYVAHPDVFFTDCITSTAVTEVFAPSSAGTIFDWLQLNNAYDPLPPSTPLTVVIPADNTPIYAMLEAQVPGIGLRADAVTQPDYAAVIEAVSSTPGAIGVVSLTAAEGTDAVKILSANTNPDIGCVEASRENVEGRLYSQAERLFAYFNRSSAETNAAQSFLEALTGEAGMGAIAAAGFTVPSETITAQNQAIAAGEEGGRQFSQDVVAFQIPDSLSSQFPIRIGGSPHISDYITVNTEAFATTYPAVTFESLLDGTSDGVRRFCNGELDILVTYRPLTEDEEAGCVANQITPAVVDLGDQSVVLVANTEDTFLHCMTTDAILRTFDAETAGEVTLWNDVDPSFPEARMVLFAPPDGTVYTDVIMRPEEGPVQAFRADTETDPDPLYRAAATAVTDGALTFMNWFEYQGVVEDGQGNIELVAVDSGDGCVTPSPETIADGSYPYSQSGLLIVNMNELPRLEVQSFLWYLADDANYPALESAGLLGVAFGDLPAFRDNLQSLFAEAAAMSLDAGAEATPEATPDVDAEATPEATPEATEEPS